MRFLELTQDEEALGLHAGTVLVDVRGNLRAPREIAGFLEVLLALTVREV